MPRFEPFIGLRYGSDPSGKPLDPADVTAPPYDVIDADERQAFAERHPFNIVALDVPVDDGTGTDPYEVAATELARWQEIGVLVADPSPAFTRYRMTFTDEAGRQHRTLGVMGALELAPPARDVLPHERTTPKAKSDRLRLLQATHANLSPIWGLSLAGTLSSVLDPDAPADASWTDSGGVTHEYWRIDDPDACARISAKVASAPVVVADGHHRYETALTYRNERRSGEPGAPPDAELPVDFTLALVVELAPEQLVVQPIHRLLNGVRSLDELRGALAHCFTFHPDGPVTPATLDQMIDDGALCLVTPDGEGTLLVPKPDVFDGVDELDSARLDAALAPLEPAPTQTYQHGIDAVLQRLRAGDAEAAVLLRPVPVPVIEAMAHAHALMPPKSTFFAPKPATGVVIRLV